MTSTNQPIDFKKVFSKLSHIKALSHDQKFDQIVQNLITHTLNINPDSNPKNETELSNKIQTIYGISIRNQIILSNLDKLLNKGDIIKDPISKRYQITQLVSIKLKKRIEDANNQENEIKTNWFSEILLSFPDFTTEQLQTLWSCLSTYLCNVFEQHGIQTLNLLNPNTKINADDQKSLFAIIDGIVKETNYVFSKELLSSAINHFIFNADEKRTNYLSKLADSTFTSFALTSDAETVNFLNQRYNTLNLFLDTNFIFGILDLHKNSEDASAREILAEVKKNNLPFKLTYHPETLSEFKRTFDNRAMILRASNWTRETSRVALAIDGLSPLEELFHKQNLENQIDPSVFLDKYDHVELILKDLGLNEFIPLRKPTDVDFSEIQIDVEKYQKYYESIPNRKQKSYMSFKHDIVVIREVRELNPKKTKFLESKAFFISSDYILAKFEKINYKRNWEINYVVSPSVFLQLIRPFIENDYSSNKRFIDTFTIPEFRTFEIDYSSTRSKALQILNDNYHNTSFETKVKILRDQVLLEKLDKVTDDHAKQMDLIESQISIENQILNMEKEKANESINKLKSEIDKDKLIIADILVSNSVTRNELESKEQIIQSVTSEIQKLKESFSIDILKQNLDHKKSTLEILNRAIHLSEKRKDHIQGLVNDGLKKHRFYLSLVPVLSFSLICYLIFEFSWSTMEPITWGLSILFGIIGYLYLAIKGESFNPIKYFDYYKSSLTSKVETDNDFDNSELESLIRTRDKLNEEISILTATLQNDKSDNT